MVSPACTSFNIRDKWVFVWWIVAVFTLGDYTLVLTNSSMEQPHKGGNVPGRAEALQRTACPPDRLVTYWLPVAR